MFQISATSPTDLLTRVVDRLNRYLDLGNFAGIGNAIVEVLTRPGQDEHPDDLSRGLADNIRQVLGELYGIDPDWCFPVPYREKLIPNSHVGTWQADTFTSLMIFAFVLGASRENLPVPYDALVPFFKKMAAEQHQELVRAAAAYKQAQATRMPRSPSSADIAKEIATLQQAGLSAQAIADHIAAIVRPAPSSANGTIAKVVTPAVFQETPP